MNINDADLIRLRKDIERVRKHDEKRRSQESPAPPPEVQPASPPLAAEHSEPIQPAPPRKAKPTKKSQPVGTRLKRLLGDLLRSSEPSHESREAIPDYVLTVFSVIREQPKFRKWLLALEPMPLTHRNQQLQKMAHAFRVEDKKSVIADAFDRFHEPSLFKAVCQLLREEG